MASIAALVLAPVAIAQSGCDRARHGVSAGELQLAPAQIEFARTQIGHPVRARLSLGNNGPLPLRVRLVTDGPWSVIPELELGGGERQEIEIEFAPQSGGEHESELQVHTERGSASVELRGSATGGAGCSAGLCPRADNR